MKDLFDADRPLSLGVLKSAMTVFTLLCGATAVFIILSSLGTLFDGRLLAAGTQLFGGLTLIMFVYLVARTLMEVLAASHRQHDRLTVLSDDLRSVRAPVSDATNDKADA